MPTRPDDGDYAEPEELALLMTDPVCGRDVAVTKAASSDYSGTTYYFCSPQCQQDFERLPERYIPVTSPAEP